MTVGTIISIVWIRKQIYAERTRLTKAPSASKRQSQFSSSLGNGACTPATGNTASPREMREASLSLCPTGHVDPIWGKLPVAQTVHLSRKRKNLNFTK